MNSFFKYFWIVFLLTSCSNNTVFMQYKTISSSAWHKDSIAKFEVDIIDTIAKHTIYINIRNDKDYGFNNIFLVTNIDFPNKTVISDTLAYRMTDERGYFLGTGVTDIKENKLEFKEKIQFPNKGIYTFSIQHAMRKNGEEKGLVSLDGIVNVGIEIEKTALNDK